MVVMTPHSRDLGADGEGKPCAEMKRNLVAEAGSMSLSHIN